jgi:type IV secretion system protein VirD4
LLKKKSVSKRIIASMFSSILLSYGFLGVLKSLTEKGNVTENMKDPKGIIQFILNADGQIKVIVPLLTIILIGFLYRMLGGNSGFEYADDHGVHGTSRWGRFEELVKGKAISKNNKFSKDPIKSTKIENGIIVGRNPDSNELLIIPSNTKIDNRNVLVVGSSGSAKGQSFVYPNLINNFEETMIVTDPKGELFEATNQIKRDQGYEVYQIDFLNLDQAKYNPLDYVKKDIDAKKVAETIAKNSAKDGKEDFFFSTARDLLTGLIIYCKEKNPNANIPVDVKEAFYKVSESEDFLKELCEELTSRHPAYAYLKDASVAEGKTRSSILSSFAQQTSIFSLQDVANMTMKSDFNFFEFQNKKSILYVKIPMKSNPVEALTATFFDQLISVFYDIADKHHGRLPMDTIFLLDEFANLGKINDYEGTLSTCRGLGIAMNTIVQDFAQLETKYGKDVARTIVSNHDTALFLRTKDQETAKFFSILSGSTTARMYTSSTSQSGGIFTTNSSGSKSKSEQIVKTQLIEEGQLTNIKPDDCYVFISGYFPLKMKKSYQYEIYGDFLFKTVKDHNGKVKYKLNYEAYREKYLKSLGLNKKIAKPSNIETLTDDAVINEVAAAIETPIDVESQEVVSNEANSNNELIQNEDLREPEKTLEAFAQQYLDGEFSVIEELRLNEQMKELEKQIQKEPLNNELTDNEQNIEVFEQFEELTQIVSLIDINVNNYIEAEKSLIEIENSHVLLEGIDDLNILNNYFNEPDKLNKELDEDQELLEF